MSVVSNEDIQKVIDVADSLPESSLKEAVLAAVVEHTPDELVTYKSPYIENIGDEFFKLTERIAGMYSRMP